MHHISGPYRGYFIAAYTQPVKGGHVGYGVVSATRPAPDWRPLGARDVMSSIYPEEQQALLAAEHKARLDVEQMPPSWEPFTVPGALVDSTKQ